MIFLGADPGKSGAIAAIDESGNHIEHIENSETEADVSEFLLHIYCDNKCPRGALDLRAILEQVSAMPKQGVSSTFKFGQSYGFLRGLLIVHGIPFETVTPAKWQLVMRCRSKGDKNVTKARAQELFPQVKVTHAIADALLLAEYCRRIRTQTESRDDKP